MDACETIAAPRHNVRVLAPKVLMDSCTDAAYLMIDHTIIPGTFHRLTRHSHGQDVAHSLTLRLGRQLPDQECRRVAGDLCHRLNENGSLVIAGLSGSGKTTLLRAMVDTLMGEFHNRNVGVVDEVCTYDVLLTLTQYASGAQKCHCIIVS